MPYKFNSVEYFILNPSINELSNNQIILLEDPSVKIDENFGLLNNTENYNYLINNSLGYYISTQISFSILDISNNSSIGSGMQLEFNMGSFRLIDNGEKVNMLELNDNIVSVDTKKDFRKAKKIFSDKYF